MLIANPKSPYIGWMIDRTDTDRRILHIDMDAFFAAVEQRDEPRLRGRPVAVGRGQTRGVVAAASYEARAFGVKSAMASVTARERCPELIFVLPRFDAYRAVSADIHAIFRRYTALIEPLSLDEAYLDVTEACQEGGRTATDIARSIRAAIETETGLTASAGVSYNKFIAKLGSNQNKPDGLTVIRPHQVADFVAGLPVSRFHGVGPVTAAKMKALGIKTGADLRRWTVAALVPHFGSSADHFWRIARGIDDRPVQPHRELKSVGAEETFEIDIRSLQIGKAELAEIAANVARRATNKEVLGHTVAIKIKYANFEQMTRQTTVRDPVRDPRDLALIAGRLLEDVHPFRLPVRLLGVTLSNLVPEGGKIALQPSLFDGLI